MKVVASIQAKQASSRGLVHYIAHSKIDGQRESAVREIFTSQTDKISVEKANDFLKTGIARPRPANNELLHLVISLKNEDFERLGDTEKECQNSVKQIIRHTMQRFEETIGAERLTWVAGIHRNTDNPHVHLAIQKEYFDEHLEKKLLSRISASLLPHYEKKESGEKTFAEGLLIKSATEELNKILHEKETLRAAHPPPQKSLDQTNQRPEPLKHETAIQKTPESEFEIKNERDILARACLSKFYLDKALDSVSSLESRGATRRFTIFDEISQKHRKMSLVDLELRAEKNASQTVKRQDCKDPSIIEETKKKLVIAELGKNEAGIKRIKTILHNLLRKENQKLNEMENDYRSVQPLADKIRQNYLRQNKKLPVPSLERQELEMLQTHALEKKDLRVVAYLERVRLELSAERRSPARTDDEIAKLKAQQTVTDLKIKLCEKQFIDFKNRKRTLPVEVNGQRRTLAEVELLIEQHHSYEQNLSGKVNKILGRSGLVNPPDTLNSLNEARAIIIEKLDDKSAMLDKNLAEEKTLLKALNEFYANDTNPDKEKIEANFTVAELAEVESLAFEQRLPRLYLDNWNRQKHLIENAAKSENNDALEKAKVTLLAGRALAREVLSEIEANRAKEDLANFKKHQNFQKFEVRDDLTGTSKFVSLADVGLNQKGSILDQTLEYFLENREVRRMRHEVEKQIQEKGAQLSENVKAANNLLEAARNAATDFKTKSFFGKSTASHLPLFTPKELMTIEQRIDGTNDKTEAKNLQKILDSIDQSQVKTLPAMLNSFVTKMNSAQTLDQPLTNGQNAAFHHENDKVISSEKANQDLERKTEIHLEDRGR